MNPSLLNVDAEQAKHPFSGRPPLRSLEEFFSDVLDSDLLEDFSTPRGDLVNLRPPMMIPWRLHLKKQNLNMTIGGCAGTVEVN